MMKRSISLVILCAFTAWLTGCASTPQTHFYTLSPVPSPAEEPTAGYSVSVGPVSIPAVVDRPQIVVRTGPNQVSIDEFNRWASPLKSDIARVVAGNLASLLGKPYVTVFPQTTAAGASYRVAIDVLHFESAPGETAILDALWTVHARKEDQSQVGRTSVRESVQGSGYVALVAAHSRALERLSTDIAGAIREIEARKK